LQRFVVALLFVGLLVLVGARLWSPEPEVPSLAPHVASRPMPMPAQDPVSPHVLAPNEEAPRPPELQPGQAVTIQLTEPPAERYGAVKTDENDRFYARLVEEESRGRAIYDPSLGRAAREFVYQFSNLGVDPPSDVRTFLMTASGAMAGDTVFQHMRSNSEAETTLRQAIRAVLTGGAAQGKGMRLHVGVGEVYQPGASLSRHIGAVSAPLGFEMTPIDRRVALGQSWTLRGHLTADWQDLHALVLRPSGELVKQAVRVNGDAAEVVIPGEDQPGSVEVQIMGSGPDGPGKLAQVCVEVGQPLPTQYRAVLPPDETMLNSADKAAAYAMQLLNADRLNHKLAPLAWDATLAAIAKDHSADMRDNHFFGHLSPTTGLHPQRLDKAHYLAMTSAENVAHNPSIFEAELGLMHSLGHRRNILDPEMTHVGVGVAGAEDEDGRRRWWLTQLFARPTAKLNPEDAVATLRRLVALARQGSQLPDLLMDSQLDAVAASALPLALAEKLQDASSRALALAQEQHVGAGRLRVWTAMTGDPERLELPDAVRLPGSRTLGVAAAQREDGRVAVILLIAEGNSLD
jgi:uncharacterized protein YkwD